MVSIIATREKLLWQKFVETPNYTLMHLHQPPLLCTWQRKLASGCTGNKPRPHDEDVEVLGGPQVELRGIPNRTQLLTTITCNVLGRNLMNN